MLTLLKGPSAFVQAFLAILVLEPEAIVIRMVGWPKLAGVHDYRWTVRRLFLARIALLSDLLRWFVIAGAAAVEDESHQSDANHQRKEDSKRHRDVAVLGHMHVLVHCPAPIAEPDGGREDRQKHRNDGPGTCPHIDPIRFAARLFRAGERLFPNVEGIKQRLRKAAC